MKGEAGKLPLAPSPTAMKLERLSEEALQGRGVVMAQRGCSK